MSYLIIILAIVIIILLYYIYSFITSVPRVANKIDLSKGSPTIDPTQIKNAYSKNYTISMWVYVKNLNAEFPDLIKYGTPLSPANNWWTLTIATANALPPTLKCSVKTKPTGDPIMEDITITDNFSIQKWVYIATVVTDNYVECYLNGAFVTAKKLTNPIHIPNEPTEEASGPTFTFNNPTPKPQILINLVSRWDYPLSAGDIYNNYLSGNGEPTSYFGPSYTMDINLARGKEKYVLPVF
jgi:hypothetical protein